MENMFCVLFTFTFETYQITATLSEDCDALYAANTRPITGSLYNLLRAMQNDLIQSMVKDWFDSVLALKDECFFFVQNA